MRKMNLILIVFMVFATAGGILAFKAQQFLPANSITSYTAKNAQGELITLCTTGTYCLTNQGVPTNTYTTFFQNHVCGPIVPTFRTVCND